MTEKEYLLVKTASGIDSFIDWLEKGYLKSVALEGYLQEHTLNLEISDQLSHIFKNIQIELYNNIETKEDED